MSGLETVLVGTAVAAAVSFLVRRVLRFFTVHTGGGCCGKCPLVRPGTVR